VRARVCQGLDGFGLVLDARANADASGGERRISAPGSRLEIYVIPTDEEGQIARDAAQALRR